MKFRRITALSMAAAMAVSAGVMVNAADLTTADQPTSAIVNSVGATRAIDGTHTVQINNKKTVVTHEISRDKSFTYYKFAIQNRSACGIYVRLRQNDDSGPIVRTMYVSASSTESFRNSSSSQLDTTSDYYLEITPEDGSKVMNATIWYKTANSYGEVVNSLGTVTE